MKLVLKTRVTNPGKASLFLRWLGDRGQYLTPGQTVVVEGAYPTAVIRRQFKEAAAYDIEHGRVKIALITNIPVEAAGSKVEKAVAKPVAKAEKPKAAPAPAPAEAPRATQVPSEPKPDARWSVGSVDDAKPKAVTLPGHEDVLTQTKPATLEIFPDGPSLETPAAEQEETPVVSGDPLLAAGIEKSDAEKTEEGAPEEKAPKKRRTRRSKKSAEGAGEGDTQ